MTISSYLSSKPTSFITKFIYLILIVGLILPTTPAPLYSSHINHPHAQPGDGTTIQPLLRKIAAEEPTRLVRVIVQQAENAQLDAKVIALGGEITRELELINGFAADLPAGAAKLLAQEEGLRYLSLDAPMVEAATMQQVSDGSDATNQREQLYLPMLASGGANLQDSGLVASANVTPNATNVETVRDEFTSPLFNNSDGSTNWATDWIEIDPQDGGFGPEDGQIQIIDGKLRLDDTPNTGGEPSMARTVDLTGATSAIFSFDYETTPGVDAHDAIVAEVSSNGGASYSLLATFTDIVGSASGTRHYDISDFISAETRVRFRVTQNYDASDEFFKVDNVQVSYSALSPDSIADDSQVTLASNPVFTTWATEFGTTSPALNSVDEDFEDASIIAGRTIWFNSAIKADPPTSSPLSLHFDNVKIHFTVNKADVSLDVPNATVIYDPEAKLATTHYDDSQDRWITTIPPSIYHKEAFLTGLAWPVAFDLPPKLKDVTWSGRFTSSAPAEKVEWKWAAAVYSNFAGDYKDLAIKPTNDEKANPYKNKDKPGTPQNHKPYVLKGGTGKGGKEYVGHYSHWKKVEFSDFANPYAMVDSPFGAEGTFSHASKGKESFAGFEAEVTPGFIIGKVEVVLHGYATADIDKDIKIKPYISGKPQREVKIKAEKLFKERVGAHHRGAIYLDITDVRDWQWADFSSDLELLLEHHDFKKDKNQYIHYDAIGLRVTSIPGIEKGTDKASPEISLPKHAIDSSNVLNAFPFAVRAPEVWNQSPDFLQGQHMTIAVVDSGIGKTDDLNKRVAQSVNFGRGKHNSKDNYGHGTFVATMAAGNGKKSRGAYIGIAPHSKLINLRVSDDQGIIFESDVVAALQWILENKDKHDIRVVNLSLNSSVPMSHHNSPMSAAVEILWFNGVVVVVAAGNTGTAELHPPANDPYVITVGATDDRGTWDIADDFVPAYSAYGTTIDGYSKPDLVAPGTYIEMYLPNNNKSGMGKKYESHQVNADYFRMSGTSMAAPIVAGAVALLLQDEPDLTPDQVKYRLMATANKSWPGYDPVRAGAGYLDIYAAVNGTDVDAANQGNRPHVLLAQMALVALWTNHNGGDNLDWDSVNWDSVNWDSVNWDSVNWDSVNWDSVDWDSVNWGSDYWDEGVSSAQVAPKQAQIENVRENEPTQPYSEKLFLPLVTK